MAPTEPARDRRTPGVRDEAVPAVSRAVAAHTELPALLHALRHDLQPLVRFEVLAVAVGDPASDALRLVLLEKDGPVDEAHYSISVPVEGSYIGLAVRTGEPVYVPCVEPGGPPPSDRLIAYGFASFCAVPLVTARQTLGTLSFGSSTEAAYTPEDVRFMARIGRLVALAIENALQVETIAAHEVTLQRQHDELRLSYTRIEELNAQLAREKLYLEDEIRHEQLFEDIIGRSPALRRVLQAIETVAPTDSTVLISGETGTGKELVARAIHQVSERRSATFVKLNCAAIPSGLLESELFGHERGAFTGAISQRIGRFELAQHGTVFLDEVGEIPLELQPKLLRVLQEREFERLGSSRTLRTDARLIAASNRDLAMAVDTRRFRQDLFYRLNVFPIQVPPLRERRDDIPMLVRHFVHQFARRMKKGIERIPAERMDALVRYDWPGNIRELQNVVERAVILSRGPTLEVPVAELSTRQLPPLAAQEVETLEQADRRHILAVLEATNWVIAGPNGAAARLGMKRSTLQFRMRKLGITRPGRHA